MAGITGSEGVSPDNLADQRASGGADRDRRNLEAGLDRLRDEARGQFVLDDEEQGGSAARDVDGRAHGLGQVCPEAAEFGMEVAGGIREIVEGHGRVMPVVEIVRTLDSSTSASGRR